MPADLLEEAPTDPGAEQDFGLVCEADLRYEVLLGNVVSPKVLVST